MTIYNRGDVVLVPFPFSNQTIMKKRPAVIISSDVYNNTSSGETEDEILKEYPFLKKDDIKAALLYAAKTVSLEETVQI